MIRHWLSVLLLGVALLSAGPAWAQQADSLTPAQRAEVVAILRHALTTDPSILRDAVVALQADENAHAPVPAAAALAQAGPALTRTPGDPVAGDAAGDVTLVEFYDLRCPYCRRMVPVMAEALRRDPHLRLVYKDIPILGPSSVLGARAVLAAQRQGGYQKLHDAIMQSDSGVITEASLQSVAVAAGLDWPRLQRDMADPAIAQRIEANVTLAHQLGIDGTPAYVVGGHLLTGAMSLADLQAAIAIARKG